MITFLFIKDPEEKESRRHDLSKDKVSLVSVIFLNLKKY